MFGTVFRWVEGMVDPFGPHPNVTPDKRPLRFLWGHMRPFGRVMGWAAVVGAAVAALELGLIWYAGRLVDLMSAGPAGFWAAHGYEVAFAALFLLLLRPFVVGLNAIILFSGISTNLLPQVRWRAHRHLLGQPVGFFRTILPGGWPTGS
jgi:ATP-binding cassette, subfamily B, multidrug efflux pump